MLQTLTLRSHEQTARPAATLSPLPKYPLVMTITGGYQVDLGPSGVRRGVRFHLVRKDRTCNCGVSNCPGVHAVKAYLKAGGLLAAEARPYPHITLERCPICAGQTRTVDERWECLTNHGHYFEYRVARLRAAREGWLASLAPAMADYHAEISTAFTSSEARAAFLAQHALTWVLNVE